MDSQTLSFYSANADEINQQYLSCEAGVSDYFAKAFVPGSEVLDIGCGSGRDLQRLHEMDCLVTGLDACPELLELCGKNFPNLKDSLIHDSLPKMSSIEDQSFNGILCSAVLMHLPEEQLFDTAFAIRRVLKLQGSLLISIPAEDDTINPDDKRDDKGRLFNGVTPDKLQLLFERVGFQCIHHWVNEDSLKRDHRQWHTLLFRLESNDGSRGIDKIESVLTRDNKVATYKLALFRSLADLAQMKYNSALWHMNHTVSLPIEMISEKWLEYYWPIFEFELTNPEIKVASAQATSSKLAFGDLLTKLIVHYRQFGGLPAFISVQRNNRLTPEVHKLYRSLISKLNQTIKSGPVRYAGPGQFSIFQYENKRVHIPVDIWRELSIMGSWIQDATILRWAELTSRISKSTVRPSEVIDLLIFNVNPERDVYSSREFYKKLSSKECVWSGKTIKDKFVVDHAIPFALWRNNDLWNLLPADEKVNGKKSDKLPTGELLHQRKPIIIHYWEQLNTEFPERFAYEAKQVSGAEFNNNWQNKLFGFFTESIEVTAIQRRAERWQP